MEFHELLEIVGEEPVFETTLLPAQRGLRQGQPQRLVPPVAIFAAALLLSAVGHIPVRIAFVAAVVILIMGKFVLLREAYARWRPSASAWRRASPPRPTRS